MISTMMVHVNTGGNFAGVIKRVPNGIGAIIVACIAGSIINRRYSPLILKGTNEGPLNAFLFPLQSHLDSPASEADSVSSMRVSAGKGAGKAMSGDEPDKGVDFHLGDCPCGQFACVGLQGLYYCLDCFKRELAALQLSSWES